MHLKLLNAHKIWYLSYSSRWYKYLRWSAIINIMTVWEIKCNIKNKWSCLFHSLSSNFRDDLVYKQNNNKIFIKKIPFKNSAKKKIIGEFSSSKHLWQISKNIIKWSFNEDESGFLFETIFITKKHWQMDDSVSNSKLDKINSGTSKINS